MVKQAERYRSKGYFIWKYRVRQMLRMRSRGGGMAETSSATTMNWTSLRSSGNRLGLILRKNMTGTRQGPGGGQSQHKAVHQHGKDRCGHPHRASRKRTRGK